METLAVPGRRLAATGGLILLGLGLLMSAIGIWAANAEQVEGFDFGRAVAPFVFAFAVLGFLGAARSHAKG